MAVREVGIACHDPVHGDCAPMALSASARGEERYRWRYHRAIGSAFCAKNTRVSSRAMVVALALALLGAPALALGQDDELPAAQDNGAENSCGNPCTPSDDPPPKDACNHVRSSAGSVVERRLPRGPVHADGLLAFRSGVCVYLPPGYDGGELRYPVVYLLHGGGGDQGDWISQGFAPSVLDDAYKADARNAVIVVTPDGTSDASGFDRLDGSTRNELYVLRAVIPFIDRHYRTIADRRGRAIAGLSNG